MKNLIIQKLIIISQLQNKAKIIDFDPKLTILKSQDVDGESVNRVGKSFVMKSIFYAFGAALSQYTVNWNDMNISTIVYFSLDGSGYKLYRNANKTILMNDKSETYKFSTLSELKDFFVDLFNFKIKLIKRGSKRATHLYPGAMFMPFYIDQDKGWSGDWGSFKDIFQSDWKKEILLFHLGVKPNIYYDILDEQAELKNKKMFDNTKYDMLESFYNDQISRNGKFLDINVKIDEFKEEIIALTEELNDQLEVKNAIKAELISCFDRMLELNVLYKNARINLSELVEDIEYINCNISEEHILCPTCGTAHDNSVKNRFMMFTEVEECNSVIDNYYKEKKKISKKIDDKDKELKLLENYIDNISSILNIKRNNISFEDVIKHEGVKTVVSDLKSDLNNIKNEIGNTEGRLTEIANEKRRITREGNGILTHYYSILKENLLYLDVNDIARDDIKTFDTTLKCGGNDTPTAILAQVFALSQVSSTYSNSIVSPIVLDAIFQQEPAKGKIDLIWKFIEEKQPKGSQLIISTTEMHGAKPDGKIITLLEKRALLSESDYKKAEREINLFKSILLS